MRTDSSFMFMLLLKMMLTMLIGIFGPIMFFLFVELVLISVFGFSLGFVPLGRAGE